MPPTAGPGKCRDVSPSTDGRPPGRRVSSILSALLEVERPDGARTLRELAGGTVDVALEEAQVERPPEVAGPPPSDVPERAEDGGGRSIIARRDPTAAHEARSPAAEPGGEL